MFGKNKEKRFIKTFKQDSPDCEILVDIKTGVNYLIVTKDLSVCLTPLLDANGKPLVTPLERDDCKSF